MTDFETEYRREQIATAEADVKAEASTLFEWLAGLKVGDEVVTESGYIKTVTGATDLILIVGDMPYYYSRRSGRAVGDYRNSTWSGIYPVGESDRDNTRRSELRKKIEDKIHGTPLNILERVAEELASGSCYALNAASGPSQALVRSWTP